MEESNPAPFGAPGIQNRFASNGGTLQGHGAGCHPGTVTPEFKDCRTLGTLHVKPWFLDRTYLICPWAMRAFGALMNFGDLPHFGGSPILLMQNLNCGDTEARLPRQNEGSKPDAAWGPRDTANL